MAADEEPKANAAAAATGTGVSRLLATARAAQKHIRSFVADSSRLVWTDHIKAQMAERSLDTDDVLDILKHGYVDEVPIPSEGSDLKATISLGLNVGRTAAVVLAYSESKPYLILITAFWVDGK